METIKINCKSRIDSIKEIGVKYIFDAGDRLLIVLNEKIANRLTIGEELPIVRYVYDENNHYTTIQDSVRVLERTKFPLKKEHTLTSIDASGSTEYFDVNGSKNTFFSEFFANDAIYTTKIADRHLHLASIYRGRLNIKNEMPETPNEYDAYFDDVHKYLLVYVQGKWMVDDTIYYYDDVDEPFFIIEFSENHNIFAQDIAVANDILDGYYITVENGNFSPIGVLSGVSVPLTGLPRPIEKEDTIFSDDLTTCGKFDRDGNEYLVKNSRYIYCPSNFSKKRVIVKVLKTSQLPSSSTQIDILNYIVKNGVSFSPKYTPFYFHTSDVKGRKVYNTWYDPWWPLYEAENQNLPRYEIFYNEGFSRIELGRWYSYWHIPSLAISSENPDALGVEDIQGSLYVDEIIDRSMPDVIDMERLKYLPVTSQNSAATEIDMYFHFRKREEKTGREKKSSIGYPEYKDSWNISEADGASSWWNGMNYNGEKFDSYSFNRFYNASGETSDLLGYLNFTDDDVYYRKSRLSKSFVRLSFYTSKDPIEQKLLYYSTIFLDDTRLYGKFMKQYINKVEKDKGDNGWPLVFYPDNSVSARLDTQITIRNEYYTEASSEGFNLYLFADDADAVNSARTIYMKVEFNHAGNGKTIPMIIWPNEALTASNFIDNLYIPVNIRYDESKERYCYQIDGAKEDGKTIKLILFEPKLDSEDPISQDLTY